MCIYATIRFYYASSILISSSHLFVHFVLPFLIKGPPGRLAFSYADLLGFLFSLDKSIGSGCFFQI